MRKEMALRVVFGPRTHWEKAHHHGGKYQNSASLMQDDKYFKNAIRDWIKRIKPRVIELTNHDNRLREMILLELSVLDEELKKFPKEDNATTIIATLISIVGRLLGYDWNGTINREVIFFQNEAQEKVDLRNMGERTFPETCEFYDGVFQAKTKEIVKKLTEDGFKDWQIADILNINPSKVKKIRNS